MKKLFFVFSLCSLCLCGQAPRKIIVDQDARGPANTDMQSILVFLQAREQAEVLGITLCAGDQFIKEQTQRTLRLVEIAGRTDVPVIPGAEMPLLNSKEESEQWEKQFGPFTFKGAWDRRTFHPPDVVPELAEGQPSPGHKPLNEHAALFINRMVRKYPGEVTLWAGGPLTNIALALALDPELPKLAKELVIMGASFYADRGGITRNGRREFNWWFDPEAVRMVMSAPWKKVVITPVDISIKTSMSDEIKARIAKADTPVAGYLTKFSPRSFMWDEISAIAWLDPSIITAQREMWVNIDIGHGIGYGETSFFEGDVKEMPGWWKKATVQFDLDTKRFYDKYVELMTRAKPQTASFRVPYERPGAQKLDPETPGEKKKVFIDQDSRGPVGTDVYSVLLLAQSPQVEVLGMSITAGDGWAKAGTQVMLRMLELTGHGDIPVAQGAEFPLINSREETRMWEAQWGEFSYKGAWNERSYHEPGVVPQLAAGNPTKKPVDKHGALLLIETLRKYPGEVTVWVGGPFTTVALACRLDPEVPKLAKELVVMGAGMNAGEGGNHRINARREFNWWWDPEAARIVMSAPWKKITITPVDISIKTRLTDAMIDEIAMSNSAAAKYINQYHQRRGNFMGYMWDEIAAGAFIDPGIITNQKMLQVNIDIEHGPSYGQTIFMEDTVKAPSWMWQKAVVQFDLDTTRFYRMFVDLMKR